MGGGVPAQPAAGLLELALAADPVAAARLIPGDRHVDESLQEVALGRRGGAPRSLEMLVRREVLAGDDQLQPALVAHGGIFAPSGGAATFAAW